MARVGAPVNPGGTPISAGQCRMLRVRMLRQAQDLIDEIHVATQPASPDGEPSAGDDAQVAARVATLKLELREIHAALRRMDESAFGVCTQCGSVMPLARLTQAPQAERCVNCETGAPI